MEAYHWLTLAFVALGFLGSWILGAFKFGRSVEQIRAAVKHEVDQERDKILDRIETIELRFDSNQKSQDHNFGEVGAAMRQYIADVEKKVREVEIYGRDNYVKIPDFEKAMDRLSSDIRSVATDIKKDFKDSIRELKSELAGRT
jgi:hypothetical protein